MLPQTPSNGRSQVLCVDATPIVAARKGIGVVLEGLIDSAPAGSPLGESMLFVDSSQLGELSRRWPGRSMRGVRMRSSLWWESISLPAALRGSACRTLLTMRERTLAPKGTNHILWLFEVPDHRVQLILGGTATRRERIVARHSLGRFARVTKRVAHFIVSSNSTRRDLMERYSIAGDRISIVYPGVPHAPQGHDRGQSDLSPAGAGRYVLHFATGDARDNTDVALRAFASLADRIPDEVSLVLAGVPEQSRSALDEVVLSLGIGGRTRILGYVPAARMPALFASAEVYFDPTLFEGFGLQLVEAMANGTPVVASNVTSVPEIVGKGGILAAPDDEGALASALAAILRDPDRRSSLSAAARAESSRFSWPVAVAAVNELAGRLDG